MTLELKNVSKSFGGVQAVDDLSFRIEPKKITSIIGPNGAGKTTVFNLIVGYERVDSGRIWFDGEEITWQSIVGNVERGVVRTFQEMRVFLGMSVLDNIMVAGPNEKGESFWRIIASPRVVREQTERKMKRALELLEWASLSHKKDELAANISYGEQKILSLLCALSAEPRLLLLDEPTSGLNLININRIINLIRELTSQSKTILMVEHNMEAVMDVSDWVIVLNLGGKIAEGPPSAIRENSKVTEVYLGA